MKYGSLLPRTLPLLMVGLMVRPCLSAQDNTSRQGMAVLNRHCTSCHGQTPMSALDLRHRESALKGGNRGPAVVPGNARASLLYQAASQSGELKMPPGQPSLPVQDLEALREWIDQGFVWEPDSSPTADHTITVVVFPASQPSASFQGRWIEDCPLGTE